MMTAMKLMILTLGLGLFSDYMNAQDYCFDVEAPIVSMANAELPSCSREEVFAIQEILKDLIKEISTELSVNCNTQKANMLSSADCANLGSIKLATLSFYNSMLGRIETEIVRRTR